MENNARSEPVSGEGGYFIKVRDGKKIYVWENNPVGDPLKTVYLISGITGINHRSEDDIIDILGHGTNRVVVVHPRGTGYSEGDRGDTDPADIIEDYCEIIFNDSAYLSGNKKILLFGHSMSCAFALEVAARLPGLEGLILVNPPYRLKPAKGMSPGFRDYLMYIGYYLFAPHKPFVNMAGDPSLIADGQDRMESEQRNSDPLLVKYFSMHCMAASRRTMKAMILNARQADYPLLLLYGGNDNIVDRSGCDEIYAAWEGRNKQFDVIAGGSHGKSSVLKGSGIIVKWIECL
jgi:pimeloyl-ACP methyl ester carboxylesterase